MAGPILVINPNSSSAVTEGVAAALTPLMVGGGPAIDCMTLAEGPPAIETQDQIDAVIAPLCALAEARPEASAYVVACFSDPGLGELRSSVAQPVFGIGESAYLTALSQGRRFGVISILPDSVQRHLAYLKTLGLVDHCAGDRPLGLGVAELADRTRTWERLLAVGRELRDHDGAEVLILGCAGMAGYRRELGEALALPVIEPCQAAVTLALGRVLIDGG